MQSEKTNPNALPSALIQELTPILQRGLATMMTELYAHHLSPYCGKAKATLEFIYNNKHYETTIELGNFEAATEICDEQIILKKLSYTKEVTGKKPEPIPEEKLKTPEFHSMYWYQNVEKDYLNSLEKYLPGITSGDNQALVPELSFVYPMEMKLTRGDITYQVSPCPCGGVHVMRNGELWKNFPAHHIKEKNDDIYKAAQNTCIDVILHTLKQMRLKNDTGEFTIKTPFKLFHLAYERDPYGSQQDDFFLNMNAFFCSSQNEHKFNYLDSTVTIKLAETRDTRIEFNQYGCKATYAVLRALNQPDVHTQQLVASMCDDIIRMVFSHKFPVKKAATDNTSLDDVKSIKQYRVLPIPWIKLAHNKSEYPRVKPHEILTDNYLSEGLALINVTGQESTFDAIVQRVNMSRISQRLKNHLINTGVLPDDCEFRMLFHIATTI